MEIRCVTCGKLLFIGENGTWRNVTGLEMEVADTASLSIKCPYKVKNRDNEWTKCGTVNKVIVGGE